MESFSYNNIFDTKGIEYLVIIAFLCLLIPFWIVLNRQVKITRQLQKVINNLSFNVLRIPQGLFYGKNHTWAHLYESGIARIGIDDFLLHLTGRIGFTKLLKPGDHITKGELMAVINQQDKTLNILAPVSGKIVETNTDLSSNPSIINEDPYAMGWIYKINPTNWIEDTSNCYLADKANAWTSKELERYKDFVSLSMKKYAPEASRVILQDGGAIIDSSLSELPVEIWADFEKEFLKL